MKSSNEYSISQMLRDAAKICSVLAETTPLNQLDICEYQYDISVAVKELGLEKEVVYQLVDEYVTQVIKAVVQFEGYLAALQSSQDNKHKLDYTTFRDLAHKNLGVARNLRIKDAEVLLCELMTEDNLAYLLIYLEALKICAIRLHPKSAYNTMQLNKSDKL